MPGTDTCKLGISSSRALAAELGRQLQPRASPTIRTRAACTSRTAALQGSGQHHVAIWVPRSQPQRQPNRVPHFQWWWGTVDAQRRRLRPGDRRGSLQASPGWSRSDHRFAASASKTKPSRVRHPDRKETIRHGRGAADLASYEQDRRVYSDWGDHREYTIEDMGRGNARRGGSLVEMGLASSERGCFEAQVAWTRAGRRTRWARGPQRDDRGRALLTREKIPTSGRIPTRS